MKTLEQRLFEVEDREEMKELTAKYAHRVARGEGITVEDQFTDDGPRAWRSIARERLRLRCARRS
jgi:hypothetical protein